MAGIKHKSVCCAIIH